MKRFLITFILFFNALSVFAATKTIYVTRHGQRGDSSCTRQFTNIKEDALMPKGEEQAELLGRYLNAKGFTGKIYVSPYYRTLQTAHIISSQLASSKQVVSPLIQEVTGPGVPSKKPGISDQCLTKEEIQELFPNVKIPEKMKFPWRLKNERRKHLDRRVNKMIEKCLKAKGDVLLVTHGGVISSLIRVMNKRDADMPRLKIYNCCLLKFEIDTETGKVVSWKEETLEYLPEDLVTSNLSTVHLKTQRKK